MTKIISLLFIAFISTRVIAEDSCTSCKDRLMSIVAKTPLKEKVKIGDDACQSNNYVTKDSATRVDGQATGALTLTKDFIEKGFSVDEMGGIMVGTKEFILDCKIENGYSHLRRPAYKSGNSFSPFDFPKYSNVSASGIRQNQRFLRSYSEKKNGEDHYIFEDAQGDKMSFVFGTTGLKVYQYQDNGTSLALLYDCR